MKDMAKTVLRELAKLFARGVFLFPTLPILYLLEPFWRFRFALMHTQRIGHLAGNTDLFLRKRQIFGASPRTTLIFTGWDPANRQLFEMFKRHLPIYESRWLTRFMSYCGPLLRQTRFYLNLDWTDRDYREFNEGRASLIFTDDEEDRGRTELDKMGIGPDDWFVCIHARDSAYLKAWRPQYKNLWDTREYRNSSIENYLKAAEYITSLGGHVLRMGAVVEEPLPDLNNPRIIDYATLHRSDFMDIYLCAKARFFLGTNSGLFVISTIFDVPVGLANMVPFGAFPFRREGRFIPMLLKKTDSEKILNFQAVADMGFFDTERMFQSALHEDRGCTWVENEPEDILELAREIIGNLEGRNPDPEQTALRDMFRKKYMSLIPDSEFAGDMGWQFAAKHRDLIEPDVDPDLREAAHG